METCEIISSIEILKENVWLYYKKTDPQIVFLGLATYGNRWYVTKMLSDLGIPTVEMQHGIVNELDDAYNYSDKLMNNKIYFEYLPDYFLTYGEYWGKHIKNPSKKVVIGNYNFKNINSADFLVKNSGIKKVLFAASTAHQSYIDLLTDIFKKEPNYELIFKKHPANKEKAIYYNKFKNSNKFKLVNDGNLYEIFKEVDAVIGDGSSVLYEAKALGKEILIYKNDMSDYSVPTDFGKWFNTAQELKDLINNLKYMQENKVDYYYDSDCDNNYNKFIHNICRDNKKTRRNIRNFTWGSIS